MAWEFYACFLNDYSQSVSGTQCHPSPFSSAFTHTPSTVSVAKPEHSWLERPEGKRNCHSSHIQVVWVLKRWDAGAYMSHKIYRGFTCGCPENRSCHNCRGRCPGDFAFTTGLPRSTLEAGLSMSYSGSPCKNEAQIKLITSLWF